MKFELPKLNYVYDALEPAIDEITMKVHHDKHHQAYMNKFQAVVDKYDELKDKTAEEILKDINNLNVKETDKVALQNNGGGYINHNLFFEIMGPEKEIDEKLVSEIKKKWGSLNKFKEEFSKVALGHFGSGWVWLVCDENRKLQVYSLPNQESPLSKGHKPILNLDVWEHAYYLKYQNRRAEYIVNWWQVIKFI